MLDRRADLIDILMAPARIERTAAGTAQCTACKREWIAESLTEHADPQCLMWVFPRIEDDS